MSYQVLARKWRPKNFKELMGQEHVVTVLVNALEQQRLHHAYLFTGTRGVGKTTIARIFAKSLNCQVGITAEPCGKCDTCLDIDLGRFVDLIEIDAASKTKVDDTREILDNVQYAPTSGRYKVYLIDEVHMLSRSSFNALLKTLEEPPEHVKFILATTDPQKLPVTVLSRCLQFHLKALTVSQIEQQLHHILQAEDVIADKGAVTLLAKAARGSMRDSLSLTDQSIAQGAGQITLSNVQKMLGGVDQNWVYKILIALIKQDSKQLMTLSLDIASYSPSYSRLMAELIQLLHQIAMVQIVERHFDLSPEHEILLNKFAQAISPEDVQLYYQIVLNSRKDLPYAADEQAAFDMLLLRLLAFKPIANTNEINQEAALPAEQAPLAGPVNFDDVSLTDSIEKTSEVNPVVSEIPAHAVTQQTDQLTEDENTINQQLSAEMESIEQFAVEQSKATQVIEENAPQTGDYQATQYNVENKVEDRLSDNEESPLIAQETMPIASPITESVGEELGQNLNENIGEHAVENVIESTEHATTEASSPAPVEQNNTQPDYANVQAQTLAPQNEAPTDNISYSSPIESALATRNMLRSRKKEMEQKAKKPSDAVGRHEYTSENSNTTENKTTSVETPAPIEMVTDEPYRAELIDPAKIKSANQVDKWANMIDSMALSARIRQIAIHATISESSTEEHLVLLLDQSTKHLKTDVAVQQLQQSISNYLSKPVQVEINVVDETQADPYKIQVDINDKRYQYAVNLLKEDDVVKALQQDFQAELDENTIQAL